MGFLQVLSLLQGGLNAAFTLVIFVLYVPLAIRTKKIIPIHVMLMAGAYLAGTAFICTVVARPTYLAPTVELVLAAIWGLTGNAGLVYLLVHLLRHSKIDDGALIRT